jgi:hypothetical protein
LLSNNPAFLILAIVFTIGAVMFAVGSVLVRRTRYGPQPETIQLLEPLILPELSPRPWTADLAGNDDVPSLDVRVDMVERLAMIGEPWCTQTLERALAQDPDANVRDAADNALIVIAARA